jgi:hypothetical protein
MTQCVEVDRSHPCNHTERACPSPTPLSEGAGDRFCAAPRFVHGEPEAGCRDSCQKAATKETRRRHEERYSRKRNRPCDAVYRR